MPDEIRDKMLTSRYGPAGDATAKPEPTLDDAMVRLELLEDIVAELVNARTPACVPSMTVAAPTKKRKKRKKWQKPIPEVPAQRSTPNMPKIVPPPIEGSADA